MNHTILIFSDTRAPTLPHGSHGLGRVAYDLSAGLAARGYGVRLSAGRGSLAPEGVALTLDADETLRAGELARAMHEGGADWDAVIDLSHRHDLSRFLPRGAVVNDLMDDECAYHPPNALVSNGWQSGKFSGARIAPLGVDVDAIPFRAEGGGHLLFCAKMCFEKGVDLALDAAKLAGREIHVYGQKFDADIPGWRGEINSQTELYDILGGAAALIAPSRYDSGGRVVLEAAAAGTPVVTLDWSGTAHHVYDGVSGFVCATVEEMAEAIGLIGTLDRTLCREWARETHGLPVMLDAVEAALKAVIRGERW